MTHQEALTIAARVAMRYPVPAWSPEELEEYAGWLDDLDRDATAAVVMRMLRASDERPGVAAIRRDVVRVLCERCGAPLLDFGGAWELVRRSFSSSSAKQAPYETNPLVARAVKAFGWHDLAMTDESNMGTVRAQFRHVYEDLVERELVTAAASNGAMPTRVMVPGPQRAQLLAQLAITEG